MLAVVELVPEDAAALDIAWASRVMRAVLTAQRQGLGAVAAARSTGS